MSAPSHPVTDRAKAADSPRNQHARGVDRPGVTPYLLILPGFLFYAAFVLYPIASTLRLSFFKWDGLLPEKFVGLQNYQKILTDPKLASAGLVALVFVVFACVLPALVALMLTGLIARTKIRGLSIIRFLYFLPYTIALAVVAIAWRWLYATDGSINTVIALFIGKENVIAVLGDNELALPSLGITAFWVMFGFVTVMLLSGTQHIPKELYDAARADGAGPIREFFAVTLPGVRGELRVSLVLTFIMALRTFDLPLMTTQGGPGYRTTTPALMMYRDVFLDLRIGQGAAIAVILTLVIGAGVLIINKVLVRED
jgi:raffinose/stachyose/melibiose transport system permease protein